MVTLLVRRSTEEVVSVDGVHLHVHQVDIYCNGMYVPLYDCTSFENTESVQVRFQGRIFRKTIQLPRKVESCILFFLKELQVEPDFVFDCFSLVCFMKEVPEDKTRLLRYWDLHSLPKKLDTGEVVIFTQATNTFCHAAIHLYKGICVSVYGAGGMLEFSTIPQMQEGFNAEHVWHAVRKEKPM